MKTNLFQDSIFTWGQKMLEYFSGDAVFVMNEIKGLVAIYSIIEGMT